MNRSKMEIGERRIENKNGINLEFLIINPAQ
jgi:hypothetical protein